MIYLYRCQGHHPPPLTYLVSLDVLGLAGEGDRVADPDGVVGQGSQELGLGVRDVVKRGVGRSSSSSCIEGSVNQLCSITAVQQDSTQLYIITTKLPPLAFLDLLIITIFSQLLN